MGDELARRRRAREHDRLLVDLGGDGAVADMAGGQAEAILTAYDRLEARAEGHCGGRLCTARVPRAALGVCGCRCPACAAASAPPAKEGVDGA